MHLSSLTLVNFRSYRQRTFDFDSGINLIIGKNGSGKTNILESIYCLSVGKSFRSASLGQLITWTQNFAIIETVLSDQTKLEFRLQQQDNSIKRQFLKNNVRKTKKLYFGSLFTIVFHPEDIRLVAGSPSRRRDFLDAIFSSASWRYHQALSQYNRALKHRNELLDLIRLNQSSRKELFFWDQSLIKNSQIIHHYRQEFIGFSNQFFAKHPHLEIRQLSLNYHPSVLTIQKLDSYFNRDLTKGYTSIGPHRDDFSFDNRIFPSPDQNSAHWGSRGQQRLAVLAVRLAQIEFIKQQTQQKPVLLLDDIFSELDDDHQRLVVAVCQNYQTIITSSDPATTSILPTANLIQL